MIKIVGISVSAIEAQSANRPAGYVEEVLASAIRISNGIAQFDGDVLEILKEKYGNRFSNTGKYQQSLPWWSHWLEVSADPPLTEYSSPDIEILAKAYNSDKAALAGKSSCRFFSLQQKFKRQVRQYVTTLVE